MTSLTDPIPPQHEKPFSRLAGDYSARVWIRGGKTLFDRAFAAAALLTLLPVFAVIALVILARRDGPVFFAHTRVGRDGAGSAA